MVSWNSILVFGGNVHLTTKFLASGVGTGETDGVGDSTSTGNDSLLVLGLGVVDSSLFLAFQPRILILFLLVQHIQPLKQ